MDSKSTMKLLNFCYLMLFSFMHFSSTVVSQISHAHTCNRTIAECNEEVELLMESEISRRFLEEGKHISYGALDRDKPVCGGEGGGRGEAYSKSGECLPPPSHGESRGCSKYYQCRSNP